MDLGESVDLGESWWCPHAIPMVCCSECQFFAQDLLAAMSIEVVAVAISQCRHIASFRVAAGGAPLMSPLQKVVTTAVQRQAVRSQKPILPRLLESLRRFYSALQKHDAATMVQLLQGACAAVPVGASLINEHLTSLSQADGKLGSLREGKSMLPRHVARTVRHSYNAYPILPPAQPFADITKNLTELAPNMAALSADLEEPPEALAKAAIQGQWAKLGLGDDG